MALNKSNYTHVQSMCVVIDNSIDYKLIYNYTILLCTYLPTR